MNKWMSKGMNGWMTEQLSKWVDEWMNKRVDKWVNERVIKWMSEWVCPRSQRLQVLQELLLPWKLHEAATNQTPPFILDSLHSLFHATVPLLFTAVHCFCCLQWRATAMRYTYCTVQCIAKGRQDPGWNQWNFSFHHINMEAEVPLVPPQLDLEDQLRTFSHLDGPQANFPLLPPPRGHTSDCRTSGNLWESSAVRRGEHGVLLLTPETPGVRGHMTSLLGLPIT